MSYKNILVAVDTADQGEKVLQRAWSLLDGESSNEAEPKLTLIHCIEPFNYVDVYGEGVWTDFYKSAKEFANKEMNELLVKFSSKNEERKSAGRVSVKLESVLLEGKAGKTVCEYAKNESVDLLVLGSHGKHGLGLLLGSTASAVVQHSPCDVLTVRLYE